LLAGLTEMKAIHFRPTIERRVRTDRFVVQNCSPKVLLL